MWKHRVTDLWCRSVPTITQFTLLWTIDDFSKLNHNVGELIGSSVFDDPQDPNTKWMLELFPGGFNSDYNDQVSVYLTMTGPTNRQVKIRISIINRDGDLVNKHGNLANLSSP